MIEALRNAWRLPDVRQRATQKNILFSLPLISHTTVSFSIAFPAGGLRPLRTRVRRRMSSGSCRITTGQRSRFQRLWLTRRQILRCGTAVWNDLHS